MEQQGCRILMQSHGNTQQQTVVQSGRGYHLKRLNDSGPQIAWFALGRLISVSLDSPNNEGTRQKHVLKSRHVLMDRTRAMFSKFQRTRTPCAYFLMEVKKSDHRILEYDSDWARELSGPKRVSGGLIMIGSTQMLSSCSRTHETVVLSSSEAELAAIVAAVSEFWDSSLSYWSCTWVTSKSMCAPTPKAASDELRRQGPTRLKHVHINKRLLQDVPRDRIFFPKRIPGYDSESDVLTKVHAMQVWSNHFPG